MGNLKLRYEEGDVGVPKAAEIISLVLRGFNEITQKSLQMILLANDATRINHHPNNCQGFTS